MAYVPAALRQQVAERAKYRCKYCQSAERITSGPMHLEHILPVAKQGETILVNLAYSCARCNMHKWMHVDYRDPVSNEVVPLFNPRTEQWVHHFVWSSDGTRVIGRTAVGRATVLALHMNHATVVMSRSLWVSFTIHPPQEES